MLSHYKTIKCKIKYGLQRMFRGYDNSIRNGWGLEHYFIQIIPEIKYFCEEELKAQIQYNIFGKDNPRSEIFSKTLSLIWDYEQMSVQDECQNENQLTRLFEYISKHMGWYWN